MRILGLDFTSAPRRAKPLCLVAGTLTGNRLHLDAWEAGETANQFSDWLARPGPWVMAVDFPLGQPAAWWEGMATDSSVRGGPWSSWEFQAQWVSQLTRDEWKACLRRFREGQPVGHKLLFRETDRALRACSPMMDVGVPVALMYQAGAGALVSSEASVAGLKAGDPRRWVVEAYPAAVARALGRQRRDPYKTESNRGAGREQRASLLDRLEGAGAGAYRLVVSVEPTLREKALGDERGDWLDALFAAVQAAWVSNWGIESFDRAAKAHGTEGLIADPVSVAGVEASIKFFENTA